MRLISILFLVIFSLWSCSAQQNKVKKLITLTYNIHHGAPANSDVVNLNDIANVIKKSGADIIALQEVDVNVPRSGNVNQAQELAKLLKMNYYFSKSIDYSGGEYGIAILSKYKLKNIRKEFLPMPTSGEQRSLAIATVQLPGNVSIEFAVTHLDLNNINRFAQVEYLNNMSKKLGKPLFIGGDYNAQPHSLEMEKLKEEYYISCLGDCPFTIPVKNPKRAIDFVVYNKIAANSFRLESATVMEGEYASDHLPLTVVFSYK